MTCKFYYEGEDKISYSKIDDNNYLYFLADGHAGDFVSSYLKNNFTNIFKKYYIKCQNIKKTIKETIKKIEIEMNQETQGSTIVGFIINDNNLVTFNIGDSRCYGITKDNKILQLTTDHNLYNQKEIKRLNYIVDSNNSDRRLDGKLAMTRSIGDNDVKNKISDPQIKSFSVNNFNYILLTSDGLYESLNNNLIKDFIVNNKSIKTSLNKIIEYAKKYGIDDDKSILIKKII